MTAGFANDCGRFIFYSIPAVRFVSEGSSSPMQYQWDHECQAFIRPGEQHSEIVQSRQCYANPEKFARDSYSEGFWLNQFQNTLHRLLEGYLNGANLSLGDRLLKRPMLSPNGNIRKLLKHAWHLADQKLQVSDVSSRSQREKSSVPKQLVELYRILDQKLSEAGYRNPEVVVLPSGANLNDEPRELAKIRQLAEGILKRTNSQLLVQGSVATGEQIGYSDLDLWLVVSRQALSQANHLQELARLFFRIQRLLFDFDPLQHHGVMLATQIDLSSYPESYLPMDALAKARFLSPEHGEALTACPRPSTLESGLAFFNLLALFRQSVEKKATYQEAFGVKSIMSHIMLLPAFFEGTQERPCFKGDSFARVKEYVPTNIWSIMEEVSKVRQNWQYRPSFARKTVQTTLRNPFLFQYVMRRGLSGKFGKVVAGRLPENWQSRALVLAEYLWEKVCK